MTDPNDIIQFLVITDQHDLVNRLLSGQRKAGLSVRASAVSRRNELAVALSEEAPALLVCFEGLPGLDPEAALKILREHDHELPFIVVRSEAEDGGDPTALRAIGAADVLSFGDWDALAHSIRRELAARHLVEQNRRLEVALRELRQRHQLLLENTSDAVCYVHEGMHRYCNPAYAAFFGYPDVEKITTTPLLDLVGEGDREKLKRLLAGTPAGEERITVQGRYRDDSEFPVTMAFIPVEFDGQACLQLSVAHAAGNSEYNRQVNELKHRDLLTRLHNQSFFIEALEQAIGRAVREKEHSALLLVRINDFPEIEATIGRSDTNLILTDIGRFLRESISKSFTAARLSDDEFGLLLYDGNPEAALNLAEFIKGRVNNRITATALPSLELSCSVGITAVNGRALDAEALIARARSNLHTPPPRDSSYQFRIGDSLSPDINDIIGYLEQALEAGNFKLLFQPVVNLKGENTRGYEVLSRLLDSDGNEVAPAAFLPAANLSGQGEALDRLVVSRVLALMRKHGGNTIMMINLTNNTLVSRTFLPWLGEELERQRLPSDRLVLQISEVDLHQSLERILAFSRSMEELNLKKAVTHFGCALDPFKHLEAINPEYVILDETQIRDITYSRQQKQTVQTLVDDLHRKQYLVGAPRVEDMEILPLLWEAGIDLVQGFCLQGPSQEMNYEFIQEQEITQADFQN